MKSNITSAANDRAAYQGKIVLTKHIAANTDSWQTGMNNNILVWVALAAVKPAITSNPI